MGEELYAGRRSMYSERGSGDAREHFQPGASAEQRQLPSKLALSEENIQKVASLGVSVGSILTEHLLSHPCMVLRRQCQVNPRAQWFHLTPFTLLPVWWHLHKQQGAVTLWKGMGSMFVLRGLNMASEAAIAEVTDLPREISRYHSLKKMGQHLLLKALSFAVVTPFYGACIIETVQSDIASDTPGVFDCLKEGALRIVRWTSPQSQRLLPIWVVMPPTVLHSLLQYIIISVIQNQVARSKKYEARERREHYTDPDSPPPSTVQRVHESFYPDLLGSFVGHFWSDVLLYPLETVLLRLHLQGTRTLIDNLDYKMEVVPIATRYEGLLDCYRTTLREEGLAGFYKGFGAVILQYAMHFAILKTTKFLLDKLVEEFAKQARRQQQRRLYHQQLKPEGLDGVSKHQQLL